MYYKSDHLDVANQCQDRDLLVQQKRRKGYVLSHGTIGFTIKEGQLVTR
ncbi:hypothetical protein [Motilimonas eburnea]|nr:hypothetical protein [Motilimonas eburnea]MCE2571701.1 hypothetical protein [Motilimonas eburnea]